MAKKQFKAESKRLLDMMIHSVYTHPEIFLRELISNASDAIDKRYYLALTNEAPTIDKEDLEVFISIDKENRTLTITDNGVGLNKDEMEDNLGTIAKSGSLAFKQAMDTKEDVDIIGQFGVGFYSAFMVSKQIKVISRRYDSEQAYEWESEGEDGYTIKETIKDTIGTSIIMTLKDDNDDEKFSDYLEAYKLRQLVKKYSDYVRYPIKMLESHSHKIEDSEEYETVEEVVTLNSMVPLWKRNKQEITAEEYESFYQDNFFDYQAPLKTIHFNVEGNVSFNALLFIPKEAPFNYYTKEYEKGLKLYSRNVFIMEKASDLVPEYFRFVKGLIDSQDLSLNISREILQHDRQLKVIASKIEKKIKSELLAMLENEHEQYLQFYKAFGLQLKYGIYSDYGAHKETLQDLVMFHSSKEQQLVTLKAYVGRMIEGQEHIYYAAGETVSKIDQLPQLELLKDKGYEILYLTDDVDEFALQVMMNYEGKSFKSANQGELNLEDEVKKATIEQQTKDHQGLLDLIKEALGDQVAAVKLSTRLKSAPVCLSANAGLSLEMEKVLSAMPDAKDVKAEKVLEINGDHEIFQALVAIYERDAAQIRDYADLLYNQARLIEGLSIENPVEFSNKLIKLMISSNK